VRADILPLLLLRPGAASCEKIGTGGSERVGEQGGETPGGREVREDDRPKRRKRAMEEADRGLEGGEGGREEEGKLDDDEEEEEGEEEEEEEDGVENGAGVGLLAFKIAVFFVLDLHC
jgi:hypothetical protein